jgi:hypothetical protein
VPERVATMDSDGGRFGEMRELLSRALGRNPLDAIGIFVLLLASGAVLVNALYRQPGPHPAPIFSVKPRPVATEPAEGVVPPLPRARPVAPVAAANTEPAATAPHAALKTEALPRNSVRPDPIGDVLSGVAPSKAAAPAQAAPSPRVMQAQRALNDFGYGPVKATGVVDAATTAAVAKFERSRKLPVTGLLSPKVVKEISADTGRQLE